MDWYPWGEEALTRAREADKPILLSIGYSACHWCHVMERESFEDSSTAAFMNRAFVNIKVDREERPDLDSIYMRAVQTLTGRGGWPLTAFLLPDGRAFYGGTYFPPASRHGMPSFRQVMEAVLDAYRNRREEVERGARELLAVVRQTPVEETSPGSSVILNNAFSFLRRQFDGRLGGFGPAPKFPQPTTLEFLLQFHHHTGNGESLAMVTKTLRAMARGGIRDHLGGGFHRYSVDDRWLVPHFEKMLYDNGLLARVYLHAFLLTGEEEFRDVATSTLDYILEDLASPGGGFYASRDADSEGEEGLFYLWTRAELEEMLGSGEARLVMERYGVTEGGNFEGRNILHLSDDMSDVAAQKDGSSGSGGNHLDEAFRTLRAARARREHPFRDEKVLVGWNSFVMRALAEAGASLGRPDYLDAARKNAAFILEEMRVGDRLLRSWKDGPGTIPGFLEDYAGLGNALLTLHETTLEHRWLTEARWLLDKTEELFWDPAAGLFYDTPVDGEALIVRPRDLPDGATPSGHSLAVEFFQRGQRIFAPGEWTVRVEETLAREEGSMGRIPSAFGRLLTVLVRQESPPVEVVILGHPEDEDTRDLLSTVHEGYGPERVLFGGEAGTLPALPLLEGRTAIAGKPTAYVCRNHTCSRPLQDPAALRAELGRG